MGHNALVPARGEAMPEILTARELESFLRIDVKGDLQLRDHGPSRTCPHRWWHSPEKD
jgi:hypothetical protein